MEQSIDLNIKNLNKLSERIAVPAYKRDQVRVGMVHIGIGGFHRAHQAYFVDNLLAQGLASEWGICGIALLESDKRIYDVLSKQDGLYTLMVPDTEGDLSARVIGSIIELLYAPGDPSSVVAKMADESIRLITLTITEGGYNFDSEGNFNWENEMVLWDLQNPDSPKTIFGYLTAALKSRYLKGGGELTIQSCDNIEHNGNVLRCMLGAYISKAAPEISHWVDANVAFPNSMVDRITPATTPTLVETLEKDFNVQDGWPVICESYIQWIIEDSYAGRRPEWERAGAQMVADVTPYEKMKIRLLNGGHTLVGLMGDLLGYTYIHESIADPVVAELLKFYMDTEVTSTLDSVPGVNLEQYKAKLVERFKNKFIKDEVARIISGSSDKFPKFILPVIADRLKCEQPVRIGALIVAAWYMYLVKRLSDGSNIQDEQADTLLQQVKQAEKQGDPSIFLNQVSIFGNLGEESVFKECFLTYVMKLPHINLKIWVEAELN
ncbi:mannitol dehydrogenase family protein [Albibacterium profundi]|uniref:Mannitol dehydrogenase family protein n=1 Tax=Albibacterium profundi TaxID=3134906 RepID=A0ABV5CCY9_9SPHI